MNKPQDFDSVQAFGEYEALPAGGYKCVIRDIESQKTQTDKDFLKIYIDILEGEYKDFFKKKFDSDTREDKKWSGVWVVFIEGYNPGTTNPKFKGLITSIEASNPGFKFDWTSEQTLKDKRVGIVFREEEFQGQDGAIHSASKPFFAISYDKVEEVKVPAKKTLTKKDDPFTADSGYTDITDDCLPF